MKKMKIRLPEKKSEVPPESKIISKPSMTECPYKECANSDDCVILDIIKKIPKKKESCSYFQKRKMS